MQYTNAAIRGAIATTAARFGGPAAETIIGENERKHLREVRDIAAAGRDAHVVDLGGGVGVNFLVLRELGHAGRLVLVERFDEYDDGNRMGSRQHALSLLERAGVEVLQVDFWPDCHLELDDASFDVACCYDVIEHLPGHPLRQLRELHRLLRGGGRILIGAPNAASLMKRVKLMAGRQPYSGYEDWVSDRYFEHYREYLRGEYQDLLVRAGFSDVRSDYSAAVTYSRARHSHHRRRRPRLSPVSLALLAVAAAEWLAPPLRHTVYAEGRKR
ncbi:MAG TPA: methyltransferase domain-containing protein [Longimicrobiales bacterium]|nr:methyltransferase domain-containing protein [Longimicrobiales bacterium]